MRKLLLALGIAALAAGLSPGAFGLDVPLKYEKPANNQDMSFPYGYGYSEAVAVKPAGDWKLPALITDKPYYVQLSLGERKHLLIIDKKKAEDKFYTRLWFDRNGDGDLTDEKPIEGTMQNMGGMGDNSFDAQFPMIDVSVMEDGVKLPYCLQPMVYGYSMSAGNMQIQFSYSVMCGYTGEFKAGATQYTMRLGDRNGNGRFNDRAKVIDTQMSSGPSPIYTDGDIVFLSAGKAADYNDSQALGDLLLAGDTLFEVKIDIPKGKMALTEVKNGLSPIKLAARPERLSLLTADGNHCLMAYQPSGDVIRVPAGNYRLLFYQMYRKDAQGDLWRLKAGGTGESPVISVAPNSEAVLAFGEPFTPLVTLPPTGQSPGGAKGSTPLQFVVEGRGKEILTEITHLTGTATQLPLSKTRGREMRPKEPSYTIVKSDGEIVAKGSFEYG